MTERAEISARALLGPGAENSPLAVCLNAIEIGHIGKVFRTRLGTVWVETLRDVSFSISAGQSGAIEQKANIKPD